MNTQTQTPNAITVIDGFVDNDPTQSPLHGTAFRFKDGDYFAFTDKLNVEARTFAVFDKGEGWQKLAKDCPPEYLMRVPGEPRPPQPHVEKQDWPLNLNNQPETPLEADYLFVFARGLINIAHFASMRFLHIRCCSNAAAGGVSATDAIFDIGSARRDLSVVLHPHRNGCVEAIARKLAVDP